MQRIFLSTILLLALGAAAAQAPDEYTLLCGDEVIGSVTVTEAELDAAVLEDFTCSGEISIAEDETLIVTLEREDGDVTVTVTGIDGSVSGKAEELPDEAVDGREVAEEARADAGAEGEADESAEGGLENAAERDGNADDGIGNANDAADDADNADEAEDGAGNADDAGDAGSEAAEDGANNAERGSP